LAKARVCLSVVDDDQKTSTRALPSADLVELRLDLIGGNWPNLARKVTKPWIACNRRREEGGKGSADESQRQAELLKAVEAGARIVDFEYRAPGLKDFVARLDRGAELLLSYHDLSQTPGLAELARIVEGQIKAGAQICKVVTTARDFGDNLTVLELVRRYSRIRIVAFAMGEAGKVSRILSPLVGGYWTYASAREGKEAASGQIGARELRILYDLLKK
jgi:3-dehydroquinate dehydratase-1